MAATARMTSAGFGTESEEGVTCCYAVQDKVWAIDPDGHRWEVFVVTGADAAEHSIPGAQKADSPPLLRARCRRHCVLRSRREGRRRCRDRMLLMTHVSTNSTTHAATDRTAAAWGRFSEGLWRWFRAWVNDDATADDRLQTLFLRVHEKQASLHDQDRIGGWIWRIARNVLADHYRSRRRTEPLDDERDQAADQDAEDPIPDELGALATWLGWTVDDLPPAYRDAVALTELEGKTAGVDPRLHRAHRGLLRRDGPTRRPIRHGGLVCQRRGRLLMDLQAWTTLFVGLSFALYVGIAIIARVRTTRGFYVAGHSVPAVFNGMATAADWMSAAIFISMAGLISSMGYIGAMYLMGWTGGYVLLALLLAPYLRKFGKYTVPDFVGDRYYSNAARLVAIFCAIFVSFTYVLDDGPADSPAPGFVAQVVAFAFGLAASSFFPVLVLGIFSKPATREAGIAGMLVGILSPPPYIIHFKFVTPETNNAAHWLWGISPEGIGSVGMVLNFIVMGVVSRITPPPPQHVQDAIEAIRSPSVESLHSSPG